MFGAEAAPRLLQRYHELEPELESETYRSYREVLTLALEELLREEGLQPPEGEAGALARSLPDWQPFPEVPDALAELRNRGWKLAILSNSDRDLIAASQKQLGVPFDLAVVAEDVQSYKPAHAHWERFFEATTADREHHVHVAASLFHDVAPGEGARAANDLGQPAGRAGRAGAGPRAARPLGTSRHRRRAGARSERGRGPTSRARTRSEAAAEVFERALAPALRHRRHDGRELREDWSAPDVDFPDDVLVAEAEGRLVGYADVIRTRRDGLARRARADPAAYQPLLEAIAERAAAHEPAHVRGWAPEQRPELHEAYERAGFRPVPALLPDGDRPRRRPPRAGLARRLHRPDAFAKATSGPRERRTWTPSQTRGASRQTPYETWAHWYMGE